MDPNLKPAIDEPAISDELSVSSLTTSLVQLEINAHNSTVGPINLLPSEMMQLILSKLRLHGNVKKLIRLRLVSTRWRAIVEDYCQMKKSLVVVQKHKLFDESVHTDALIRKIFGFEYTKDYACLLLNPKLPSECLKSLLNIFPSIVDLYIWFERPRVSDFVVYINSLDSLKQLDLDGQFFAALSSLSGALSKLEYISFGLPYYLNYEYSDCESTLKGDDHHQLISHLGSSCVRVKFNQFTRFVCDQILQWHNLNPLWLANLTHLQLICIDCSSELKFVQVVQFLGEHAPLKFFSFEAGSMFINSLHLTPTVIHNLGKLTNLAELQLKVKGDFLELNQHSVPLTSLSTVVSTKLVVYYSDHRFSGDLCTRLLSAILPNLVDLKLTVVFRYATDIRLSQHEIEQHLDRFPNLRKHKIHVL